jgi:hypothetical protein
VSAPSSLASCRSVGRRLQRVRLSTTCLRRVRRLQRVLFHSLSTFYFVCCNTLAIFCHSFLCHFVNAAAYFRRVRPPRRRRTFNAFLSHLSYRVQQPIFDVFGRRVPAARGRLDFSCAAAAVKCTKEFIDAVSARGHVHRQRHVFVLFVNVLFRKLFYILTRARICVHERVC